MNTDNMLFWPAKTLDYSSCAFLDHYDPRMPVFSRSDITGRYATNSQGFRGAIGTLARPGWRALLCHFLMVRHPNRGPRPRGRLQEFWPMYEEHLLDLNAGPPWPGAPGDCRRTASLIQICGSFGLQ